MPVSERIYYVNMKECMSNSFSVLKSIPFHIVDSNIGLDMDASLTCSGVYSYKIADAGLFYKNVSGNVVDCFYRSGIERLMASELLTVLPSVLAEIFEDGVRAYELISKTDLLCERMLKLLKNKWGTLRGIEIVSLSFHSIHIQMQNMKQLQELQRIAILRNPSLAAATVMDAQSDSMKTAAVNQYGSARGIVKINIADHPTDEKKSALFNTEWKCKCGTISTGRFCPECGVQKPEGWNCICGSFNKGKFCGNCGRKKPE